MKSSKLRNDLLIVFVPILIGVAILLCNRFMRDRGNVVKIEQDGTLIGVYSLDEDMEIIIGEENGSRNTLVIRDGKADMIFATCPDKVCVNHRSISFEGERIVCLPNKVTVRIEKE